MDRYAEGIKGEEEAKKYLQKKGYIIQASNVNFPGVGELDIVAMDKKTLVFVEVRTRSDNSFGHPFETVNRKKRQKIISASRKYLSESPVSCDFYRYDVIAVLSGEIEHIEDAFYAKW